MQTELHRHLDVSVRLPTLLKLAQERGLEAQSTSIEAFREKIVLTKPLSSLREVLDTFSLFQMVLDRPDVLEQVAFEVIEDCYLEGTRKVELRWAPGFVCELSKLKWEDALDGFEAGFKKALEKYPDMKAGMLCIAVRDLGPEHVAKSVEFFLKHQHRFAGIDLAGNETEHPCHQFERSMQKLVGSGARITIHAGEASGPENMWEAIELLGAQRIGHGLACVKDPKLMQYLAEKEICLEMCPTSNWLTGGVTDLSKHPLSQVLRAGIPVCANTDDPAVFGITLPDEIRICREKMGLSETEIAKTFEFADKYSFLT